MNLAWTLAASAAAHASRPAIVVDDTVESDYALLLDRVSRRAGDLVVQGVRPGDRVALYLTNRPDYLEALYAIWWCGAVAVPLSSMLHPQEAADLILDSSAEVCWVSPDLAEGIVDHPAVSGRIRVVDDAELIRARRAESIACIDRAAGDDAWIFYTSGTTGKPKGARLTHDNLWAMSVAYCADVEWVDADSGLLHVALQSHASGLFALPFIARGGAQVVPTSTDADHVARLLGTRSGLTFFAPPILLRRLADSPVLSSTPVERMGTVLVGAAPVHADDLRRGMAAFGPRIWNGYGQGESPLTITAMGPKAMAAADAAGDEEALVSVGIPRIGTRVRVVDEQDRPIPDGEIGEVVVSGPTVMAGYLDRPEATAETLRGGWLHTGDLGRFDRGLLTLLDRSKDMVITGGANVYPREIEEALRGHESVTDIAVIGLPDPEWGERVVAFVVPARETSIGEMSTSLDAYCLENMARYKRPKEYHLISDLPRNGAGKVLKTELRRRLLDAPDRR